MQPPSSPPATGATGSTAATGPTGVDGLVAKTTEATDKAVSYVEKYGPPTATVFIVMIAAWFFSSWARRTVRRGLERAHFDLTLSKFLANMVRWVILAVAVVMCLGKFGVETASFAALIGATGLAIGLGFQGSLSNLAAGVMLLVFRPFKVGDGVKVAGQTGVVNEIDLFTTSMDTADGRRVIIPNGAIFGSIIENQTYHPHRRIDVPIAVAGTRDIEEVRAILVQAARATPGVLADPAPAAVLLDPAGNWSIQAWAATGDVPTVGQSLIGSLRLAAAAAGLGGPRPVMDVTIAGLTDAAREALRARV